RDLGELRQLVPAETSVSRSDLFRQIAEPRSLRFPLRSSFDSTLLKSSGSQALDLSRGGLDQRFCLLLRSLEDPYGLTPGLIRRLPGVAAVCRRCRTFARNRSAKPRRGPRPRALRIFQDGARQRSPPPPPIPRRRCGSVSHPSPVESAPRPGS